MEQRARSAVAAATREAVSKDAFKCPSRSQTYLLHYSARNRGLEDRFKALEKRSRVPLRRQWDVEDLCELERDFCVRRTIRKWGPRIARLGRLAVKDVLILEEAEDGSYHRWNFG